MSTRLRSLLPFAVLSVACHQPQDFGPLPAPGPRGVVTTPVRDYPFGDAVDVYRAALDLLYVDGEERPSIIVMYDSAFAARVGAPCPQCPRSGPHKALIDTSTVEGFEAIPRVQPRLRQFGYKVPIVFYSNQEFVEMWSAGRAYDSTHSRRPTEPQEGFDDEFRRRYPGAWGWAAFSLVGFNQAHTEALLEIRAFCGGGCHSIEVVFFKKVQGRWQPIERLPREVQVLNRLSFPYRGPIAQGPGQSEMVVDQRGDPLRPDSKDAPSIYRAVLDSLYSFYGEHPRTVVISDQHRTTQGGLPPHESHVDSSTIAAYNFFADISDRLNPTFSYRLPVAVLSSESRQMLDREGVPLEREANLHFANEETSGFWLAFRNHFPGAWGYVELSRIAFNHEHTQALALSVHHCGSSCESGDTWLLTRDGERWSIAERMRRDDTSGWQLDSLRYLGRDADPKWYRSRRAHGVFSNAETGAVLPSLNVTFERGHEFLTTIKTDSAGRYTLENLPLSSDVYFKVKCPIPGRTDTLAGPFLMTREGLDTTLNVEVQWRGCTHLNRAHPLIAGKKLSSKAAESSALPPDVAAVYRGVLDALYPPGVPERAPIMLEGFTSRRCDYCIEPEVPRLIRKGLIDPSTEVNFAQVPADTTPPSPFSYRRKIEVMTPWDLYWLGSSGGRQWDAMNDAYPGVKAVISFSRVGFNDRGTEALVEVHLDSAMATEASETILLKKAGAEWSVALRHVEHEGTSGEWSGGKCEPTDAPAQVPTRADMEKLVGEFSIVRVGASRVFRGRTGTLRVRLEALKPSPSRPSELVARASVIDATGEPEEKIAATFKLDEDAATITFTQRMPKGQFMLDGWIEWYKILRTDGRGFFGTWFTETGPTIPRKGYFCAIAAPTH
jgi:hypothetical protein